MEYNPPYPLTNASRFLHLKPRSHSISRSESASLRLDSGSILSITDSEITTPTVTYSHRSRKPESSKSNVSNDRPLLLGEVEVAHYYNYEDNGQVPQSGLPTIPDADSDGGAGGDRPWSPLPLNPPEEATTQAMALQGLQGLQGTLDYDDADTQRMPSWQSIHGRLLSWAIAWPMSELENALKSTTRGHQIDEVALTIWSTQTYKRYVRARLTDSPLCVVDRLFVPPNAADAINNAVFNGRHADACGMLKDLWVPFHLEGVPRLLVVLAKHRSDPNHWVVHRFSLPNGELKTYDTYPDRTLPDGRPLGWWFAIRLAWPNPMYSSPSSPDQLYQKMIRIHRPLQLSIDNSVAAAGIWRNILMSSRAERTLDLERLRELINMDINNVKRRKQLGMLSVGVSHLV